MDPASPWLCALREVGWSAFRISLLVTIGFIAWCAVEFHRSSERVEKSVHHLREAEAKIKNYGDSVRAEIQLRRDSLRVLGIKKPKGHPDTNRGR